MCFPEKEEEKKIKKKNLVLESSKNSLVCLAAWSGGISDFPSLVKPESRDPSSPGPIDQEFLCSPAKPFGSVGRAPEIYRTLRNSQKFGPSCPAPNFFFPAFVWEGLPCRVNRKRSDAGSLSLMEIHCAAVGDKSWWLPAIRFLSLLAFQW